MSKGYFTNNEYDITSFWYFWQVVFHIEHQSCGFRMIALAARSPFACHFDANIVIIILFMDHPMPEVTYETPLQNPYK